MAKVLQEYTFREDKIITSVHINYQISSAQAIDISTISTGLALKPTRSWSKGDGFYSKSLNVESRQIEKRWRIRSNSIWILDSREDCTSKFIAQHLMFLLKNLESKKDWITNFILNDSKYRVSFQFTIEMAREVIGFELNSELLARASKLASFIEFSIIGPEP
jgi:hypothetical protein